MKTECKERKPDCCKHMSLSLPGIDIVGRAPVFQIIWKQLVEQILACKLIFHQSVGPSLNMGATLATFHVSGKTPEDKERFKISQSESEITGKAAFKK